MAIASPSAPAPRRFYCAPVRRRFLHPIPSRVGVNFRFQVSTRPKIASRLYASSSPDGEVGYDLNNSGHGRRRGTSPVYVMLPADAVGPAPDTMKRKRIMEQSFRALAAAGVEGVVMEVWWGLVERQFPGCYNWIGYLKVVEMAKRCGLRVRAVLAFHQYGIDDDDPKGVSLPLWVLESMDRDPDVAYADRFGRRNREYISLGCDTLPVLLGRTPIQAYSDLMRNFRDTFSSFLGSTITGIQVGLGPGGELRYPSCPTRKLNWPWRVREFGDFQCYDKYMVASLKAHAQEVGMHEWGQGGPLGTGNVIQNLEDSQFFKNDGSWNTPYGDFFLKWYSEMLLLHGERICSVAEVIFHGRGVSLSGKLSGIHWHYGTQSHPSELTSGYYNTRLRDGIMPIVQMFSKYGFAVCCPCFEMQDAVEQQVNPNSSPENFLKQVIHAAWICQVPMEGENFSPITEDDSFEQVLKMSRLYCDGMDNPSFSFNFARMHKNMFDHRNWISFTRFVRQMSRAVNVYQGGRTLDSGETGLSSQRSTSSFAGGAVAY